MTNKVFPKIRIATRKSPLALQQANYVKNALEKACPTLDVEIIGLLTEGDKLLTSSLSQIGGKGLFVKELEKAVLEHRADMAVHSIKDMPVEPQKELILAAVCKREDPRDVFLSNKYLTIKELPKGSIIGTSSSRRACLLRLLYPQMVVKNLRGNVGTRLKKLDAAEYDGIILAAAGLNRLGETDRLRDYLDPEYWVPAVGQGAVGIECHRDNDIVQNLLSVLEHPPTRLCITAERAMNQALGGGCQLPIAAFSTLSGDTMTVRGFVAHPVENITVTAQVTGQSKDASLLGEQLARELIARGASFL